MERPVFYFSTIKNTITAFGMLFDNIRILDESGNERKIPVYYSPKEKFMEIRDTIQEDPQIAIRFPRIGFEMTRLEYSNMRVVSPLNKIQDYTRDLYMFSRVPYDVWFNVYIGTRKFEDSLKIIEQIIPFFVPDLSITVKDKDDFGLVTDIPITLTNTDLEMDYEGEFEKRRSMLWTLTFVAKIYLYSNIREQERVKKTIISMSQIDFNNKYEVFTQEIYPKESYIEDDYEIIKDITTGSNIEQIIYHLKVNFYSGEKANTSLGCVSILEINNYCGNSILCRLHTPYKYDDIYIDKNIHSFIYTGECVSFEFEESNELKATIYVGEEAIVGKVNININMYTGQVLTTSIRVPYKII